MTKLGTIAHRFLGFSARPTHAVVTAIALVLSSASAMVAQPPTAPRPEANLCKSDVALGFVELRRARYFDAKELFESAREGTEGCRVEAQLGLAGVYNSLGQEKRARVAAETVIAAASDSEVLALAHYELGRSLHRSGGRLNAEKKAAAAAFERAIELSEGKHELSIHALAKIWDETGREAELEALKARFPQVPVRGHKERMAQLRKGRGAAPCGAPTTEEAWEADLPRFRRDKDGITTLNSKATPPKPVSLKQPEYTKRARKQRLEGIVRVEIRIDPEGKVTQARVLEGLEHELDENTLATVCQWKFEPSRSVAGDPVPCYAELPVKFALK